MTTSPDSPHLQTVLRCRIRKPKESQAECEDAVAGERGGSRFAVADGVTSKNLLAGFFADYLVDRFASPGNDPKERDALLSPDAFEEWIRGIRPHWVGQVDKYFETYPDILGSSKAAWREGQQGSQCTFAGIEFGFDTAGNQELRTAIVGDSAIYYVTEHGVARMRDKAVGDESSRTGCVQVLRPDDTPVFKETPKLYPRGPLVPGYIILVTDAMADWIEARLDTFKENPMMAIEPLLAIRNQSEFEEWFLALRSREKTSGKPELKSDDLALIVLEVAGNPTNDPSPPKPNDSSSREKNYDTAQSGKSRCQAAGELLPGEDCETLCIPLPRPAGGAKSTLVSLEYALKASWAVPSSTMAEIQLTESRDRIPRSIAKRWRWPRAAGRRIFKQRPQTMALEIAVLIIFLMVLIPPTVERIRDGENTVSEYKFIGTIFRKSSVSLNGERLFSQILGAAALAAATWWFFRSRLQRPPAMPAEPAKPTEPTTSLGKSMTKR